MIPKSQKAGEKMDCKESFFLLYFYITITIVTRHRSRQVTKTCLLTDWSLFGGEACMGKSNSIEEKSRDRKIDY